MTPKKAMVELTARCKPFTGEPVANHRVMVMVDDVNVRVYDPVAGYFTTCHSLGKAAIKRIIAKAARSR